MFIKRKSTMLLGLIILLVTLVLGLSACSSNTTAEIVKNVEPVLFLYKNAGSGEEDLYIKRLNKEPEKLASSINRGSHLSSTHTDKIVYTDQDNQTYLFEEGKEKYKLGSDINSYRTQFTEDNRVLYLTEDNDLYIKAPEKERFKLASEVWLYSVVNDNMIYFVDNEDYLYKQPLDGEKEKLASDVDYFSVSYNGKSLYYVSLDQELYSIIGEEKNKIATEVEWLLTDISHDGDIITFVNDYNYEKDYGELYIKENNKEKEKIASDVTFSVISEDDNYI